MDRIGKYTILASIGKGATGVVYKAFDPRMERIVALKVMSTNLTDRPELRSRFLHEGRSAARLSHENIITIYDYEEIEGQACLVLEFLDGTDLSDEIASRKIRTLEQKTRIMIEICNGLAHAHGMGIIHRDIKPGNIFMTRMGTVKILDFGLAGRFTQDLNQTGQLAGTPAYMAPEQLREDEVDERSDIFSLGAVFYEILAGTKAFAGESEYGVSFKILNEDPLPLDSLRVPAELAAIVQRALRKKPAERYQQVREMRRDLLDFRAQLEQKRLDLHEQARAKFQELERRLRGSRLLMRDFTGKLQDVRNGAPWLSSAAGETQPSWRPEDTPLDYAAIREVCDALDRDIRQFQGLIARQEQSAILAGQGHSLFDDGDLEGARAKAAAALKLVPEDEDALDLMTMIEQVEEHLRRTEEVHALLTKAATARGQQDFALAVDQAERALLLQPGNQKVRLLLSEIRREMMSQGEQLR